MKSRTVIDLKNKLPEDTGQALDYLNRVCDTYPNGHPEKAKIEVQIKSHNRKFRNEGWGGKKT